MPELDPFAPPSAAEPSARPAPPAYGVRVEPYAMAWTPRPVAPLGLGTATIALGAAWTVLQVLMLGTSFSAADELVATEAAGGDITMVLTAYDGLGTVQLPVMVVAFVVGCLWLQGSRRFAEATVPAVRHRRGPVWVWLGWVVPVVSLWFPFQVVRDVCAGHGVRSPRTLGWWWACWLVALWFTNQAAFASSGFGSRDPSTIPFFEMVATPVTVVGFVLWLRIVRAVGEAQRARLTPEV